MKIYACAMMVASTMGHVCCSAFVWAGSGDEAMGRAVTLARERWPLEEGFTDHQAGVVQVDDDWIVERAAELEKEQC